MLIAVGQINNTVCDMRGNVEKMLDFAQRAYSRGAELIVFPELAICGYPPRDLVRCDGFQEENQQWLLELSRTLKRTQVCKILSQNGTSRWISSKM